MSQLVPSLEVVANVHKSRTAPYHTHDAGQHDGGAKQAPHVPEWTGFAAAAAAFTVEGEVPHGAKWETTMDRRVIQGVGREWRFASAFHVNIVQPLNACGVFGVIDSTSEPVNSSDGDGDGDSKGFEGTGAGICSADSKSTSPDRSSCHDSHDSKCNEQGSDHFATCEHAHSSDDDDYAPSPKRRKLAALTVDPASSPRGRKVDVAPLIGRPRMTIHVDGVLIALVEMFPPWYLSDTDVASPAPYLQPLLGYMMDNNCPFGALTTYTKTWFVRMRPQGDFAVSPAVCDMSVVLRSWAFFITQAKAGRDSYRPLSTMTNSPATPSSPVLLRARSSLPVVAWTDLRMHRVLGCGRSGVVLCGRRRGSTTAFAIKCFDLVKDGTAAFLHEVTRYQQLASLPGAQLHLPSLFFVTASPSGNCVALGMELCSALPAGFAQWSVEQREEAHQALKWMAEAGLAHNDIRETNFVVNRRGRVVAIDLEDTRDLSQEERRKYDRDVRSSLQLMKRKRD